MHWPSWRWSQLRRSIRSSRTLPDVGRIEPTSIFPSVVLPAPDFPTTASEAPGFSEKVSAFSTTRLVPMGT